MLTLQLERIHLWVIRVNQISAEKENSNTAGVPTEQRRQMITQLIGVDSGQPHIFGENNTAKDTELKIHSQFEPAKQYSD
jgi:hypothetical protein